MIGRGSLTSAGHGVGSGCFFLVMEARPLDHSASQGRSGRHDGVMVNLGIRQGRCGSGEQSRRERILEMSRTETARCCEKMENVQG